jgi:hypothetical protein
LSKKSNVVALKADQATAGPALSPEEEKLAEIYETTDKLELRTLAKSKARRQKANAVPRLKVTRQDERDHISIDHPGMAAGFTLLMEGVGTCNPDFAQGLLAQIANIGSQGPQVEEAGSNFVLSIIAGIEPRDEVESMLALQMAAVHNATIAASRRLSHASNIPQSDSAEKAFNKLARTYATQMEALKRYRSKGEQRVYVERVNVEPGGQAVVGNVSRGEG